MFCFASLIIQNDFKINLHFCKKKHCEILRCEMQFDRTASLAVEFFLPKEEFQVKKNVNL